jgi:hypothetical protein
MTRGDGWSGGIVRNGVDGDFRLAVIVPLAVLVVVVLVVVVRHDGCE